MTIEEKMLEFKKVKGNRVRKIKSDFNANDFFEYYKANGGTLDKNKYKTIIKAINKAIAEDIVSGNDIILPCALGSITPRKKPSKIKFEDGVLKTNLPVDWKRTLELWATDDKSRIEKKRVFVESKYIYMIRYENRNVKFNNKLFIEFKPCRPLKQKFKENIINNNIDTFLYED